MKRYRPHGLLYVLLLATLLLGSCGRELAPTAEPAATSTPQLTTAPTATSTPQPTAVPTATPEPIEWVTLESAQGLAQDPTWACVGGVQVVDGRLELQAGDGYLIAINARGPRIEFEDNVGLSATLEIVSGDWAAFTIFGALPQGAWWQGIKRLDLSWSNGQVGFTFWEGSSELPWTPQWFPAPDASSKVQIGLRKHGDRLTILVDGAEVGQTDDPGLFPDNRAYLGANVKPNNKLVIYDITVEGVEGQESTVKVITPQDEAAYVPSSPALRELAAARSLAIGAAVAAGPLRCDPAYAEALGHEFSILTTENAMKFGPIHPESNRYSFADADAIVDFADEHDMLVRGHVLVWHQQLPGWVEEGQWTRDELMEVLHDHITTVVGRYRGRVDVWDVVNEAIEGRGLRNTVWHSVIGPEYLDLAFQWAHVADPDALLFYNDYSAEGMNTKSDAVYDLVKGMLDRGVPIHGVGLQMHIALGQVPPADKFLENMDRLADLGLQVHITELDVRIRGDPDEETLARQAEDYREIMDTCLAANGCTAFITWGFTDRYSWIPSARQGWGSALILDASYQPKPAYTALQEALSEP